MTTTTAAMYTNPLDILIADPFVLRVDSPESATSRTVYYMYGTRNTTEGFDIFESSDLVNWVNRGLCFTRPEKSWGDNDYWAPEVVVKDGEYIMYYVVQNSDSGKRNIGLARASSPTGPFTEAVLPMFPGRSVIDPHVFRDPKDNKWYIYVTNEDPKACRIMGARLNSSLLDVETSFTYSLLPDQEWEHDWIEGAFILPHKGKYYMMYSGFAYWEPDYNIGYAIADTPLGPYKKFPANPIVRKTEQVHGPGHHSVTTSPDGTELFMVYHRHREPGSRRRVLAIDRMAFAPNPAGGDDLIICPDAPSHTPQPYPSASHKQR